MTLAFEKTEGDIIILGGTGTRLDHVLGNIGILGQDLPMAGLWSFWTSTIGSVWRTARCTIKRESSMENMSPASADNGSQGGNAGGILLPLHEFTLTSYTSIGISNEIVEEEARISFDEGVLVIIESKD